MDTIFLHGCAFLCNIGAEEEERNEKQKLLIDVELAIDAAVSARSKNLSDTVNYSEVYDVVKNIVENGEYILVEELAEKIAQECLKKFNSPHILVRIKKPRISENRGMEGVGVEIIRPNLYTPGHTCSPHTKAL
jgi:FolB domain-containing protein